MRVCVLVHVHVMVVSVEHLNAAFHAVFLLFKRVSSHIFIIDN